MRPPKGGLDFGSATPTFGPAAKLPDLADLSPERVRGDGSGQTKKYGNRKVELDGYKFDSEKEAKGYLKLVYLSEAGVIDRLEVHPVFPLYGKDGSVVYTYTSDFSYHFVGDSQRIVEDYKSETTNKKDTWRVITELDAVAVRVEWNEGGRRLTGSKARTLPRWLLDLFRRYPDSVCDYLITAGRLVRPELGPPVPRPNSVI